MLSQPSANTRPEQVAPMPAERELVGREEQVALALRRWDEVAGGTGHLLVIAGEAGIGKTRLLHEIASRVVGARQLSASVFPRDVEAVGGVLLDLCAALSRAREPAVAHELRDRLTSPPEADGDPSRARRMLVSDLAAMVIVLLERDPILLCIEDLHWADELSLDVLERIAATMRETRSMILATYRSDELYPRTPLRRLRARLLEQRLAEEVRLPRLDAGQTATLVRSITATASGEHIKGVFDRSEGIPLYVEELLDENTSAVPDTIADAVAVQTARLRPETIPVLEAGAVIGRSFDVDLLEAVAEDSRVRVDAALRELAERNLILPGSDRSTLDFRHALIRDAVYENIAPLRKRDLHAAVARAGVAAGFGAAFLSDQFERARQPSAAYRYATVAARDARSVSSHREAVELFRRAQRTAPHDIGPTERAVLYSELAEVLAATDDNESAAEQLAAAIDIYRRADNEVAAARLIPRLAAVRHLLGADYDARARLIDDQLRRLEDLAPEAPVEVRAALLSSLAAAYMLDRCLDDAMAAGAEAAALAEKGGAVSEQIDIDLTVGSVLVFAGPGSGGWPRLESAITRARELRFETQAARGSRLAATG